MRNVITLALNYLVALWMFSQLGTTGHAATTYYISPSGSDSNSGTTISSPLATLNGARLRVQAQLASMTSNITVYLLGGTYWMDGAVAFTEADSGCNGFYVIYRNYDGTAPVLSGGQLVSGWQNLGNGIYKTNVGTMRFRQLYVNGRTATRARIPNSGSYYRLLNWDIPNQKINVNASEVGSWTNLANIEMVIARSFNQNRLRLSSINISGATASLTFQPQESPSAFSSTICFPERLPNQAYCFENALEFLDAEDEWYLDNTNGDLYYKPRSTEPIASSRIIAPKLSTLISITGSSLNTPANHIQFSGLTFEHTTWNTPTSQGYVGRQGGLSYSGGSNTAIIDSAVYVNQADNLSFDNNVFHTLGGNGLTFYSGCHNNTINGNLFRDISGGALAIDYLLNIAPADSRITCGNNTVTNNYIYNVASEYWGSVGLFLGYAQGNTIQYNELSYMPYSGMSLGWGWTSNATPTQNNIVQYNHLHHTNRLLHDGGAIYSVSRQSGTVISNNFIHNVRRSRLAGVSPVSAIYLDQGSSYLTITQNVLINNEAPFNASIAGLIAANNTVLTNDALIASVVNTSGPQAACLRTGFSPGLVGYWKMETGGSQGGQVADSSGYGNNGVISGTIPTVTGICGNALYFNGNSQIVVPDNASLQLKNFTLAAWIKPDLALAGMTQANPWIIDKHYYPSNVGYAIGVLTGHTNQLGLRCQVGSSNSPLVQTTYIEALSGIWMHISATYDGNQLFVYKNGILQSVYSAPNSSINYTQACTLSIGKYFQGAIDEVRIYNTCLTADDIRTLVGMKTDHTLMAYWPLDDGFGASRLSELSANTNVGIPSGTGSNWETEIDGTPSLHFDGTSTALLAWDSPSLRVQSFTIAAFVCPDTTLSGMLGQYPAIVDKHNWNTNTGYCLESLVSRSDQMGIRCMSGPSVSTVQDLLYPELSCQAWTYIVATYNGSQLKLYQNGILKNVQNPPSAFTINYGAAGSDPLYIGNRGFQGKIRELKIFNRALTDTEIQNLGY